MAVYAATKHAVLGFTSSLQGDLRAAGLPIRAHAVCPDGADTEMTRERFGEPDSAIIWSAPRMLSAAEAADAVVALLDSKRLVLVIPRWRGWIARSTALAGRHALASAELLGKLGERRRSRR
jgi:short-subunit dehydrogenase